MTDIAPAAVAGEGLISAAAVTSRRVNELRSFDQRATTIRESAARFGQDLGLETVGEAEGREAALEGFEVNVTERETALMLRQSARRESSADLRERQALTVKHT